jgi:hypothetical protein
MSQCGKCGGLVWEISKERPSQSNFDIHFVRCASCKVPVAAMEYYSVSNEVMHLKREVESLSRNIQNLTSEIYRLTRR